MTTVMSYGPQAISVHLAVNDLSGNHTGFVSRMALYAGHELEPLLDIAGAEMACGVSDEETGYLVLQIGAGVYHAYSYKFFIGKLIWDFATISLADAARVVNNARERGWTVEEGNMELWHKYEAGAITVEDLTQAMGEKV